MTQHSVRRALVLEPSGNLWGSERVLLDFLGVASKSNWKIAVCCPPATPILEVLNQIPVEIYPVFTANLHQQGRAQRLRAMLHLLRAARSFRPCVIYVNQAGATRIALAVGRLLRVPVVTHVRLAEDVRYVASLQADPKALPKVVCISHTIRRLFDEETVSLAQLEMIYDPYAMQHSEASQAACGQTVAFEAGVPVFSCVGRLARIKGQDVLLEAMAVLQREGVAARALFLGAAGPGDDFERELKHKAQHLGIERSVTWAGFQNEAVSHLARCAAQVCPSRGEPLGRVVFEAWDAGTLPVAWAGSGGPAEVIEQSGGGLLYKEQSGEDLARTLKTVLDMKTQDKTAMIERGRNWLRANCDPQTYTRQMLDWWEDAGRIQ